MPKVELEERYVVIKLPRLNAQFGDAILGVYKA